MKHGHGILTSNGSTYEGNFIHDKKHGRGRLTDAKGHVVSGEFENDHQVLCHLPHAVYRDTIQGRYHVERRRSEELLKYADWASYAASRRASLDNIFARALDQPASTKPHKQ